MLKMELTSLCATFSPFRFFFLSLLADSDMVGVQLARRRGLTFGFSPSCKDWNTNKGTVRAALVWSKYSKTKQKKIIIMIINAEIVQWAL